MSFPRFRFICLLWGSVAFCCLFLTIPNICLSQEEPRVGLDEQKKNSPGVNGPVVIPMPVANPPALPEEEQVRLDPDGTLSWFQELEDDAPLRGQTENSGEFNAFNYTLAFARKQNPEALARQSLKGVTFADLFRPVRQDFFRELIHVEGRLARVRMIKLPRDAFLAQAEKIPFYYEGWIFLKNDVHPICVVFTHLPDSIKITEKMSYQVSFDGYFFKLMRYETSEEKENGQSVWRKAPLLIGNTLSPELSKSEETVAPAFSFISVVLSGFLLIIVLGVGLSLYFRRGDRLVREHLAQIRTNPFDTKPE